MATKLKDVKSVQELPIIMHRDEVMELIEVTNSTVELDRVLRENDELRDQIKTIRKTANEAVIKYQDGAPGTGLLEAMRDIITNAKR